MSKDLKAVFNQLNTTLIILAQEVQESGLLDDPEVSSIYQGLKKLTEGSGMVSSPNVLAIQTMAQLMWIKEVGPAQYLDMATKAGKVTLTTGDVLNDFFPKKVDNAELLQALLGIHEELKGIRKALETK